ncbi:hypothetical protein VIGAN_UM018600 [Vigna angularis var. angularis]|uniref:Uncharacterized protein n=1 Tax=Vigna angularis var. angularis TaxID=157739 RepID=A0A0S3TDE0_PHAAN|nr:hypothetical protein VIGAN_UM018600 [Vigna angularis var. angularis]
MLPAVTHISSAGPLLIHYVCTSPNESSPLLPLLIPVKPAVFKRTLLEACCYWICCLCACWTVDPSVSACDYLNGAGRVLLDEDRESIDVLLPSVGRAGQRIPFFNMDAPCAHRNEGCTS